MARLLVLGEDAARPTVAARLEAAGFADVVDCDPAVGDCVMYVRLESVRYAAFVFIGYDHPVTRGALAVVADRAVLIPMLSAARRPLDPSVDGYLFRLPQALGCVDREECEVVRRSVPASADTATEFVGQDFDGAALERLVMRASTGTWHWAGFTQQIAREVHGEQPP
jgi:hypothetical protein